MDNDNGFIIYTGMGIMEAADSMTLYTNIKQVVCHRHPLLTNHGMKSFVQHFVSLQKILQIN